MRSLVAQDTNPNPKKQANKKQTNKTVKRHRKWKGRSRERKAETAESTLKVQREMDGKRYCNVGKRKITTGEATTGSTEFTVKKGLKKGKKGIFQR